MESSKVARIIASYRGKYKISVDGRVFISEVTGNFANKCVHVSDFPVVGDYVVLNDYDFIIDVVERTNILARKSVDKKAHIQAIATNIEYMFITTSLNLEFNPIKLERFILLAQINKITPVVIFTKSDLCKNSEERTREIMSKYEDIDYVVTSSYEKSGLDGILKILTQGKTGVFVGASGVGKSTLVNALLNREAMTTGNIREYDAQGRHTTTYKELFNLDNGSYIIDTPGIREIGLWVDDDNYVGFKDIENLAQGCKFRNCRHIDEVECNVKRAVSEGELDKARYISYVKFTREVYCASLKTDVAERRRFKNKVKIQCKNERYNR